MRVAWRFNRWESAPQAIRGFARSLEQDQQAVQAAIRLEWSNGQVGGQINRLKTLKRQMYGRAKFNLLRARVLHAAEIIEFAGEPHFQADLHICNFKIVTTC